MADGFLRSAVSPGWNTDRAVGLCAVQGSRLARGVRGARGHEDRARNAGRWRLGKAGAGRSTLTPIERGGISREYPVRAIGKTLVCVIQLFSYELTNHLNKKPRT
ncbi:hypothetical protein [Synechococcus sp. MIT S9509]|uniref:hypothetical protein n=1 Tax=Synechococcus sp. MIT S9509 TaxID=1801630 RepID=UPI0012E9666F|nr:hypothetical protein [Synechococcus sp. MIT S9509]